MVLTNVLVCATVLLVAATLLPMLQTTLWWVRALEFPRVQIVSLQALTFLAALGLGSQSGLVIMLVLAAAMALQILHIWPFSPLCAKEMQKAQPGAAQNQVTCLAINVLMENTNHAAVLAEIDRLDPDVLFLMETDAAWNTAVTPALSGYPTVLREIKDNYYGLIFATRLKVRSARVSYLSVEDTPSVLAELEAPDGTPFRFVGLHPKPPVPGEDTEGRDAEVAYAARHARDTDLPVITMGDFNTPAWSQISHRFKAVGGYLDPRVGRGLLSSFDARRWWMRMPIDQFYATEDVSLISFQRGNFVGSDHFPMSAKIRFNDPDTARQLNRRVTALPDAEEARILQAIERQGSRLSQIIRPTTPPLL
ncbi:MAG: Endonuclease [Cypionkella sp.]|uniref:endonuclease/exonuclease/phosphatase family protein n=1 Tax=Cypionkella sp. TaxID=2811411 RepID=UPI002616A96F|nr:endonuclease/exonuclease/phosphatase family protein [Cypionkella sp.]MDB5660077.1 Endonuclease [Cypionkella sp.]